ncbi:MULTISPECIES: phosphopantetheine-binding protein [Nostoc]|uniref:Phosphopantetheine-binding protein n=1 Tax=Nostoc punctiforme FACHB-252 TaxID=1357509 RepID=A0ABR8HJ85_NOSPU|nr:MULTISPECIES: phosphopantetheine-binding protein [Nostoc]MBC1236255.1 phosphopantetheine-binding protein [Nostoc sp. 2RC]MBD2615915.1 phosphopantetheine-binding protein [Nostoc punctiforme FACHB-252]
MSDFLERLEQLSPEKRELLNLFLQEENAQIEENYVEPTTQVEKVLASIWSQVLGIERVGIYDNFFELGGDSIQSIQIIAKANQLGWQLTTNQLFDYPTIAELAKITETTLLTPTNSEEAQSENLTSFPPSDFPESELSQSELNELFS